MRSATRRYLKDTTRYRYGDRDEAAREAHVSAVRRWKHELRLAEWPDWRQKELLELISSGMTVREAAERLGTTYHQVYGLAEIHEPFNIALDEALRQAAPPGTRHGTQYAYRYQQCRCCACRSAAKTPDGTLKDVVWL